MRAEERKVTEVTATLPVAKSRMTCAGLDWPNDRRIMRTQAGSDAFAIFSTLLLFSRVSKSVDLIRSASS